MRCKHLGLIILMLLLVPAYPLSAQPCQYNACLMPYPQQLEWLDSAPLPLPEALNWTFPEQHSAMVQPALKRMLGRLQQTNPKLHFAADAPAIIRITIADQQPFFWPQLHQDESYLLRVDGSGIQLNANTHLGILHGLETVLQLAAMNNYLPAVLIKDSPRFAWRGLLLDPARHFLPVETIKRQLDAMAAAKLNVLHWHLTDDQGWRLESKRFPKLHQVAGTDGYYTQDEIRSIVHYAAKRGIRVVPEIDVPGHTTALGAAYPELMAMPGPATPETHWGIHPAVLDPTNDEVFVFLRQLLEEVTTLFPDAYLHIGGDEVLPDHWQQNPAIRAFKQQHGFADHLALQSWFNQQLLAILTALDRRMIGWDEILTPDLPASSLVQSWRGLDSVVEAAQAGHDVILSTGYYLDQPQFASFHYRMDPLPGASPELPANYQAWSGWQFNIPRLRGAPIRGELYLVFLDNHEVQGFIDFAGRSRQQLQQLELEANRLRFQLDTWMGPIQAEWSLGTDLTGELVVGNAPYTVHGSQLAWYNSSQPLPTGLARPALNKQEASRVLGGEIALWGELVNADVIDRRLWPQALVVAERLWSVAELTDEDFLYQRLAELEPWLEHSLGLQHRQQQDKGLTTLVQPDGMTAMQQFMVGLEPAHYYHRLHERSVRQQYHNQAPLDRLVDFLPPEHHQLRQLEQLLSRWQHDNSTSLEPLEHQFRLWQQLPDTLLPYLTDTAHAKELKPVITQLSTLASLGLELLQQPAPHPQQLDAARQLWQESRAIQAELVLAAHRLIRPLLKQSSSTVWVAANTFTAGIEGPAFGPDQHLYLVNYQQQGSIGRVDPQGKTSLVLHLPEGSIGNGIRFSADGSRMFIADYSRNRIWQYQTDSQQLTELVHQPAMHQPNDLALLSPDTLFASDPDWSTATGQLWRITADGHSQLLEANMGTTNGIEVSDDQQYLFVNESVQRRIWRYRLEQQELTDKTLIAAFSSAGLDGMRMVQPGVLAVTRFGNASVILLNTDGQLLAELPLKHQNPTNLAARSDQLYITLQDCGCIERLTIPSPVPTH
ncbi:family 20 glycosylhydrolase [Alkalimonas amylolytica]|uniref:Hexosaminidase n=1 Tax=Alkalimonas amylolytica TaxID=152573 RepID=A0A1H3ZAN9_ALKAM|nr:family 20 glycosylhydrolase [Alkalimonas amylolytica]SEA20829.1 hexosaminidase [Alkalimonas amylolytica]